MDSRSVSVIIVYFERTGTKAIRVRPFANEIWIYPLLTVIYQSHDMHVPRF
jgi:hypothetical protein